jgi:hypothetical protein
MDLVHGARCTDLLSKRSVSKYSLKLSHLVRVKFFMIPVPGFHYYYVRGVELQWKYSHASYRLTESEVLFFYRIKVTPLNELVDNERDAV